MADVNTVVIVSNKQELINLVSSKLVLLRNLDKIKSCSFEEAQNMLEGFNPNTLILHCDNNDTNALALIKGIKRQEIYKNLPILIINENCSREYVIEAFDSGVNDILFMPIIDYELLIRTIWCLQKNETSLSIESRTQFLTDLGIIEPETGVYSQDFCDTFLKNEICQSRKYAQKACILLVTPDKKFMDCKNTKDFTAIIKKSIRVSDSIIAKNENQYYVYLQKTKLNGAYSVFERINNNLGLDAGINAGVIEVLEQDFEHIKGSLETALNKAHEDANSLIVASDFYLKEKETKIEVKKSQEQIETPEPLEEAEIEERNAQEEQNENESKSETETLTKQERIKKQATLPTKPAQPKPQRTFDKNSIKLFNQAYLRKLKVVINPVFKKYENLLRSKKQNFTINTYVGTESLFSVSLGNTSAVITLDYDGVEHTQVCLTITDGDQRRLYEVENIDFTIIDYRRMSLMVGELIDKFITVLKQTQN